MTSQTNHKHEKSINLAISFEGALIKLNLRNRFNEWVTIGIASEDLVSTGSSKTSDEILSITNPSDSTTKTYKNPFGSVRELADQIKVLSNQAPFVEVWLPDELILCQTLLQRNKLTPVEAKEIVAKSCKLKPEDLYLELSPNFRERSQKISAVTSEAIDQIRFYLKSYGIIPYKFKAKNSQPGFNSPPTFYEDEEISFKPNLISKIYENIPQIAAFLLIAITFGEIFSEKAFQTQTFVRPIATLEEEENFSLRSPLSLELLSETTFPYFAPKLFSTGEKKIFRLAGYDIGSQTTPPQLIRDSIREEHVSIKLTSNEISDTFALLVLSLENSKFSYSLDIATESINLEFEEIRRPERISLSALDTPAKPINLVELYQNKNEELRLSFKHPTVNNLETQKNTFSSIITEEPTHQILIPKFFWSDFPNDINLVNYNGDLSNGNIFLVPLKFDGIEEPEPFDNFQAQIPNITGNKLTKLNINPIRLTLPNLLIDQIFSNGEIGEIVTQVPTSSSEIEYVLLSKSNDFLPGRPEIKGRLTLTQPTISSGALGFSSYPAARPENIQLIAKSIRSKKRIRARATVGPRIPKRSFAPTMATLSNRLELDRTNLLGVFGSKNNPYALIMLSTGEMIKLNVGDQFLGWRVYGIDETTVHVQNGTNQEILRIPG